MKQQTYDLIGDIHGQHGKLVTLLNTLGYKPQGDTWRHPAARKIIFLGDYIDRGPAVRATLHTVRGMMEAGDALAIMGNHEYNAVCAETPDGRGDFLRPEKKNRGGQLITRQQFVGYEAEWAEWLAWMKRLPMFLDLGELRAVHACWDERRIERLKGNSIANDAFLFATATKGTPEHRAVENVLKGPELVMPEGYAFHDKEGIARNTVRVRWWDIPEKAQISHIAMPEPFECPGDAVPHELRRVPVYDKEGPPVFFGHYWLPATRQRAPLAPNLACLDFSAAFGDNPLTAYRWDGERVLSAEKFVDARN